MIEFDLYFDAEAARIGTQLAERSIPRDRDRLEHLDVAPWRQQRDHAGLLDCGNERLGAAVHNRNFWTIDFDQGVIDAKCGKGGENMFGRRAQRASVISQHRREFRCSYGAHIGRDFTISLAVDPRPQEHDAGVGFCRMEREGHRQAGMHPNPGH